MTYYESFGLERTFPHMHKSGLNKGTLKIFLGMCNGVGKTFAMLKAAQQLQARKVDLVIGALESHGDKDLEELAAGIESIPQLEKVYNGIKYKQLDLTALLKRKPAVALIDELAHPNPPGFMHAKRYQDVLSCLDAGISIYTTLNLEQIESITHNIEDKAALRVTELIPDFVVKNATEVQLIDTPPGVLLQRLEEGKVYTGNKTRAELNNFFNETILTKIRELALKYTAQIINYQITHTLSETTETKYKPEKQRMLVAFNTKTKSEQLIRWAYRQANDYNANWTCIYVETGRPLSDPEKNQLTQNITLARNLGANVIIIPDTDIVKAVLEYVVQNNISLLIIGKSSKISSFFFLKRFNLSSRFIQESVNVSIMLLKENDKSVRSTRYHKRRAGFTRLWQYILSFSIISGVTIVNFFITSFTQYWSASIFYLAAISFLSFKVERLPLLAAAALSGLLWDYLFIPPQFHFIPTKLEDVFMLFFYFLLAFTSSWMTSRTKHNEKMLKIREQRMKLLNELSEVLEEANGIEKAVLVGNRYISTAFKTAVKTYLKKEDGGTLMDFPVSSTQKTDENELTAAKYCLLHGLATGKFTSTLPAAAYHYVPMAAPGETIGVIGIKLDDSKSWSDDQEAFLLTLSSTISLAVQREILYEKNHQNTLIQESERLSNILLNSISHEIKTPLTVAHGSASALLDEDTANDPAARNELVREIFTSTAYLNNIISNLLSLNRLESGRLKLDIEEADPEEMVAFALKQLQKNLGTKHVSIEKPEVLPLVPCDILLIIQVLTNLIQNAVRYSNEDSSLEIRINQTGNKIFFTINDDGPGVKEEELPHLFKKFYRGQSLKKEGVGLGLSICKGIIDAHKGSIKAENRPGGGFSVIFSLPIDINSDKKGTV